MLYINAHIHARLHSAFPWISSQRLKQRAQRVQPPTASSSRPRSRHRHQPKRRSLRLRSLPRPSSSLLRSRNAPDRRRHPAHAHRERIIHVSHVTTTAVPSSSPVPIEFIERERLIRARRNFPFVIARRRRRHAKSRVRCRSRGGARRESIRIDVTVRGPSALDDAMRVRRASRARPRRGFEVFRVVRNSCDLHLCSNAFFVRRARGARRRIVRIAFSIGNVYFKKSAGK